MKKGLIVFLQSLLLALPGYAQTSTDSCEKTLQKLITALQADNYRQIDVIESAGKVTVKVTSDKLDIDPTDSSILHLRMGKYEREYTFAPSRNGCGLSNVFVIFNPGHNMSSEELIGSSDIVRCQAESANYKRQTEIRRLQLSVNNNILPPTNLNRTHLGRVCSQIIEALTPDKQ